MSRPPRSPARPAAAPRVAWLIEPRFPGGTSAALAQELRAVAPLLRPQVFFVDSKMFRGREVAPVLAEAFAELGLAPVHAPRRIAADVVILHNPAFLKFDAALELRIVTRRLHVVCHENFLRPDGSESFDVAHCLGLIERASLAFDRTIAPVSPWNRRMAAAWLERAGRAGERWRLLGENWFNICDFPLRPPPSAPRDRRGRLSRPGLEKFPSTEVLEACFPPHAERNLLLGAEILTASAGRHPHWEILPFRAMPVEEFFTAIDFLVHFTAPGLRESFGRVLAEATAAGKLAICPPETAESFGPGVVGASPREVDALIAGFIAAPQRYAARVRLAQRGLAAYSPGRFRAFFRRQVLKLEGCGR